jgi:hypothetical protein
MGRRCHSFSRIGVGALARRATALAAAGALVVSARSAAASPSAKLVYVRGVGADACPSEEQLRKAVASRLGYDPFFPTASKTVITEVTRSDAGYRGRVQIIGEDGKLRGQRDLASRGDDCAEIVSTMALAVSIALDDLDEHAPEPPPAAVGEPDAPRPPAAAEPVPEAVPREAAPPPPPRESAPLTFRASGGPLIAIGTAPTAALGASIAATLQVGWVGVRVDLRGELPASDSLAPAGSVSTSTLLGSLSGCVRGKIPFGCLGVGLGSIASKTEGIAHPASDHGRLVELVATAGAALSLGSVVYLEPFVTGALNLTPQRVEVDGSQVFSVPRASAALGLHVGGHFL